jgi:UDP-N-acetylmuramate dehydrogenase
MRGCILAARFLLEAGASARINQLSILSARMKSQPLKDKSAGCIFRNPACGGSAGALIDRCGLKGYSIGGAQISPVHANFIVNVSCAKAEDVLALICEVQRRVFDLTQIWLEPEVRQIPYEP